MKRMITYLYEYREGIRGGSAGYLKLDSKGSDCRVHLHLQKRYAGEEQGMVYFVVKENRAKGVQIGETQAQHGNADSSWLVNTERICGSPFSFADVEGMAVLYPSGKYLASCWIEEPDEEFLRGTFKPWQPDTAKAEQIQPEPDTEKSEQVQPEPDTAESEAYTEESWQSPPDASEAYTDAEEIHATAVAAEQVPVTFGVGSAGNAASVAPQPEPLLSRSDGCKMERMDISDIHRLPKKNWHLCSNSFLIHGFFNYHYLVLKRVGEREQEKLYLGVPGVYAKAERAMALLFGFPEFEAMQEQEGDAKPQQERAAESAEVPHKIEEGTEEQQKIPEGTFGYWFCLLDT